MPKYRLDTTRVEKPWGRHELCYGYDNPDPNDAPIGEIWFEAPKGIGHDDPDILIKYLFTSERLSVQVHPDDRLAKARGHRRGKSEAWYILSAEPDATIALGTLDPLTSEELQKSAEDGTIENRLDWKPVSAGQFWYSPAGTVHAIGAGLVLIVVQQNADLTYRLYDYGSDRQLHLDEGITASNAVPYTAPFQPYRISSDRQILMAGDIFVTERWTGIRHGMINASHDRPIWIAPLAGSGQLGSKPMVPGDVWLIDGTEPIDATDDSDFLIFYSGDAVDSAVFT